MHSTLMLNGQNRIALVNQQGAGDRQQSPQSSFQSRCRDDAKRHEVRRIVYEALGNLWIADGNGSNPRRLTRGDDFESYPTFSRDGRSIAYIAWDDDTAARIKVIGVGGGEGRIVTPEPGHYLEPTFSPDGSLIAYRKTSDGFLTTPLYGKDPGIYIVPVRGGTPKRVSKKGTQPMFGATSDRVFFILSRFTALRVSLNANSLWFENPAVLQVARNQGTIDEHVGYDVSASLIYRPMMTQNIVVRASYAQLIPGDGFDALFMDDDDPSYFLLNAVFAY